MSYNNFKSTTVRGNFNNSDYADGTVQANAIFDRNLTVSGIINNDDLTNKLNSCVKTGDFPPNTTSDLSGVKFSWNNNSGLGHTLVTNFQQQGGYKAFEFWNVSSSIIPTLLISILNNGYVLLNGINNTSSNAIEYIKNLSSDCQTQLSNLASLISTNTTNIATNTSNISTNTSNIATNTSNIATNTSNIATNTSNIATNTSNIATIMANYLTSANLSGYALSSSLTNYVLNSSLSNYLTISDYNSNTSTYYAGLFSPNTFTNTNTFASINTNNTCTHNGLQILTNGSLTYGGDLPTTTSSNAGLGIAWNKQGGGGLGEVDLIAYGQGGIGGINFYNVTTSASCYLLAQLKNTGYFICSGINNTSSTALEYCKNITSDVQTQFNNIYSENNTYTGNNTFTDSTTFLLNNLFDNINYFRDTTTYISNNVYLQSKNIYITTSGILMGKINNVYIDNTTSDILYSVQSKQYPISTIVNSNNSNRYYYFNELPTFTGQIIHFHSHKIDNSLTGMTITSNNSQNHIFICGSFAYTSIFLTENQAITMIYLGSSKWIVQNYYNIAVSTDSYPSTTYGDTTSFPELSNQENEYDTKPIFTNSIYNSGVFVPL